MGGGGMGGGGGVAFNAGFGFFPSLFGLQFTTFNLPPRHGRGAPATAEEAQQQQISRILMMVGMAVVAMLLLL